MRDQLRFKLQGNTELTHFESVGIKAGKPYHRDGIES